LTFFIECVRVNVGHRSAQTLVKKTPGRSVAMSGGFKNGGEARVGITSAASTIQPATKIISVPTGKVGLGTIDNVSLPPTQLKRCTWSEKSRGKKIGGKT